MSVLDKVTAADVVCEPFPHIVVPNALDDDVSRRLIAEFPPVDVVTEGQDPGSNLRFSYPAHKAADDVRVSQSWERVLREHVSQEFFDRLVHLFGDHIRREFPDFERRFGALDNLRAGVRGEHDFDSADVLLDAQICVNTPVRERATSVRGPHVDKEDKLFAGLLYLRTDHDDATGGDLEVFRIRDQKEIKFWGAHTTDDYVQPVSTVRYERNTLVLFLNSWKSIHGVTVRSVTPHPRLFMNLVAEVREPLFAIESRRPGPLRRIVNQVKRFLSPRPRAA